MCYRDCIALNKSEFSRIGYTLAHRRVITEPCHCYLLVEGLNIKQAQLSLTGCHFT